MSLDFEIKRSTKLPSVTIVTPSTHEERRGSIWTSYMSSSLDCLLPESLRFSHDKFSVSKKNVLRGIHGDHKSWKLVSCVAGDIFQVVVDMREGSETFLQWESFELGDNNRQMVLIPPGMGNAFHVRSRSAVYHYKLAYFGEYADADDQFTVAWNDPRLNITWGNDNPILSERDAKL